MNKLLIKILMAIWIIIAIALCSFLVYMINNNNGFGPKFSLGNLNKNSSTKVQKEESQSLSGCDTINLRFSSSDLVIYSTDDKELKVIQKSNRNLDKDQKFTIERQSNTLFIRDNREKIVFNIFNFNSYNNVIEIYIPKSYEGNLTIDSSSGDTEILSDLSLNNIDITHSSGDLQINKTLNVKEANFKSSSGDIDLYSLNCNNYYFKLSSGDLDIKSLTGAGEIHASSGEIKVNYKDISKYSNVTALSGDVNITIPDSISFEFTGHCSSGDIDSFFPVYYSGKDKHDATAKIGDNPTKALNVNTSSGDINISH